MAHKRAFITAAALLASAAHGGANVFNITPANSIQATVNAASSGDTINLAAGIYNQVFDVGSKQLTFQGAGAGSTTLTGEFLNDTVMRGSGIGSDMGGLVVRDLTITKGDSPGSSGTNYPHDGGGMSFTSSNVLVEDVWFIDNEAAESGGGAYFNDSNVVVRNCRFEMNSCVSGGGLIILDNTAVVEDCEFIENTTTGVGAGLYLADLDSDYVVSGCMFMGNMSSFAGGMQTVRTTGTISACSFIGNMATANDGGGLRASTSGTANVVDCMFTENSAADEGGAIEGVGASLNVLRTVFTRNVATAIAGGAIRMQNNGGTLTIDESEFYGNSSVRGGGFRSDRLTFVTNSLFVGNSCSAFGGAMYTVTPNSRALNCTFVANQGSQPIVGGSTGSPGSDMLNCIGYLNIPTDGSFGNGWDIRYCNIERSDPMAVVGGTGNINEMPLFERIPSPGMDMTWGTPDDDYGDLRILAGSPGIDAGDSIVALDLGVLTDFDENDRCVDDPTIANTGVSAFALCIDMGAFEFQPEAPANFCEGDADGSGSVDFGDITNVLNNWLAVCPN